MSGTILYILAGFHVLTILLLVMVLLKNSGKEERKLSTDISGIEKNQERLERSLKEEIGSNRAETSYNAKALREEIYNHLTKFNNSVLSRLNENTSVQMSQLEAFATQLQALTQANEEKMEKMRQTIERQIKSLQEDNNKKLEEMRATVDEKLHATLEQRLGESFKLVSERLEQVQKGLGEMQVLAAGVGDLKRVLSNVKTRGIWGEVHLGNLLEQILTPDQYEQNVATKPRSNERVEFAVKLPGKEEEGNVVWLPIDAKFPQEDYQRLLDAQEAANAALAAEAGKALEVRIKAEAKDISEKYISPPATTDFGVLFLPIEGLYAEVLRRPGLYDTLLRDYRVVLSGPTTLAAFLNSLQMGFRTLAVEKRSSEVWRLLGAVKTEFGKFGGLLADTHKKLEAASKSIDVAARKTRTIERKLRTVQELPQNDSREVLGALEDTAATEE